MTDQIRFLEEIMTSQGLRGTTLASLRSNLENEAGLVGGRPLKNSALEMAKGRVTRTRAAMTDVGNKARLPGSSVLNNKGIFLDIFSYNWC